MRIAVVGMARTGTTKLLAVLSKSLSLNSFHEILNMNTQDFLGTRENRLKLLNGIDSYVVKFLTFDFRDNNEAEVNWKQFDYIFLTSRDSIVDSFLSFDVAMQRDTFIRYPNDVWVDEYKPFNGDLSRIQSWYNDTVLKLTPMVEKIQLLTSGKIIPIRYEEIVDDEVLINKLQDVFKRDLEYFEIPYRPTGINYKEKCLNYAEVEAKFKELGLA